MSNDNHKLTAGKLAGLKAVSDARGVIAAAAMDQRGSLKKSLAKEKGVSDLPDSALVEFKELVTDVLTKYASAILLDPEFGCRRPSGATAKACCWPMKRPATMPTSRDGCPICSTTGRCAG
jgi:tagatose-1,6-bisphosphate aldolase